MSTPLDSQSFGREDSSILTSHEECGRQEVKEFLDYCQLPQYLECFLAEGFDSLGSVYEIMEEDMTVMNVKRGHRRLIQREIATAKGIPLDQPLIINSIKTRHPIGYTVSRNSSSKMVLDGSIDSILKPNLPVKVELNTENTSSSSSSSNINSGYGSMSSAQKSRIPNMLISQDSMLEDDGPSKRAHDSLPRVSDTARGSSVSSNDEDSMCASGSQAPKRTYRRHPRQDKNAPVKPPSAYIMFSNHARTQLKDQNLSFAELAKIVGDRWKNLSFAEKQDYECTAMRAKDEYCAQFDRYRRTQDYKNYQVYLKEFKSAQVAVSRMVSRTRKRSKPESPNSMADCSSNGTSNENGSSASGSGEFFGDKYSNDTQQDGDIDEDGKEGTKSLKSGSDSWKQRKYGSRHRYSTGSSSSSHPFELHQLQQHHGHFRDMGSNFSNVSGVYNSCPRTEFFYVDGLGGSNSTEFLNSYNYFEIEKNSLSSSQPNMNRSSKAPSSQTELSPNVSLITSKDIKPSQRSENGDSQALSWISGQDSPHSPHKPDLRRVQSYKSIESTRTSEADNKWNSAATPPLRSSSPTPHLIKPTASRKVGEEDMEVPWTERSSVPLLYSPMALPPAKSVHQKHESDQDDKQPRRRMATRSSRTNSGGQYY